MSRSTNEIGIPVTAEEKSKFLEACKSKNANSRHETQQFFKDYLKFMGLIKDDLIVYSDIFIEDYVKGIYKNNSREHFNSERFLENYAKAINDNYIEPVSKNELKKLFNMERVLEKLGVFIIKNGFNKYSDLENALEGYTTELKNNNSSKNYIVKKFIIEYIKNFEDENRIFNKEIS